MLRIKKNSILISFLALIGMLFLFTTCEIGLGEQVDVKAPEVTITSPDTDSVNKGSFNITGTVSDDVDIQSVYVTFRNIETNATLEKWPTYIERQKEVSTFPWPWSITINDDTSKYSVPDGKYEITIDSLDNGGHSSKVTRTLQIDNGAPTVLVTSPLTYSNGNDVSYFQNIDIKGEVYDASSIEGVYVTFYDKDGNVIKENENIKADGTNTWSLRVTPGASFNDGETYQFSVTAKDKGGNENTYFYHRQDIYKIITPTIINEESFRTFPSMNDIGKLDQESISEITYAGENAGGILDDDTSNVTAIEKLKACRIEVNQSFDRATTSEGKKLLRPTIIFLNSMSANVQWQNVSTDKESSLTPGTELVGTIMPPSDGSGIDKKSIVVEVFQEPDLDNDCVKTYNSTDEYITLDAIGSSMNFKIRPVDSTGKDLSSGRYKVKVTFTTISEVTQSGEVTFNIRSQGAPTLTETTVGGSEEINPIFAIKEVNTKLITLSGTALTPSNKAAELIYSVNNSDAKKIDVKSDGTYILDDSIVDDGVYSYQLTATADGVSTTISRQLTVDTTPPVLKAEVPVVISSEAYTITGTTSDALTKVEKVEYFLDSTKQWTEVTGKNGTLYNWTVPTPETEGTYAIQFRAIDTVNNEIIVPSGNESYKFIVDYTLPEATILIDGAVRNGQYSTKGNNEGKIELSGTTTDTNIVSATLSATKDGVTYSTTDFVWDKDAGTWSYSMDAGSSGSEDGTYIFTLSVKDIADHIITKSATILVDTTEPNINVTLPAEGDTVSEETLRISGTVSDLGSGIEKKYYVILSKDEVTPPTELSEWIEFSSENNNLIADTNIADKVIGEYQLYVKAIDTAGNVKNVTRHFNIDAQKPVVNINSEILEYYKAATEIGVTDSYGKITGTATDDSKKVSVSGKLNGNEIVKEQIEISEIDGGVNWGYTVPEADGSYTFTITATDFSGKSSSITKSYVIDGVAPSLEVTNLSNNDILSTASFEIKGNSNDETSGVEKVEYSLDSGNTWIVVTKKNNSFNNWTVTAPATEGLFTIRFKAQDKAGNILYLPQDNSDISFIQDKANPIATMFIDGVERTGTYITQGVDNKLLLNGQAKDTTEEETVKTAKKAELSATKNGESFEITGYSWSKSEGTWDYELDVPTDGSKDGIYKFKQVVTDIADKQNSVEAEIIIDTVAPTVEITNLTNNQFLQMSSYSITGTVTEETSGIAEIRYTLDGSDVTNDNGILILNPATSWVINLNRTRTGEMLEGENTLKVRVKDKAGFVGTTSITYFVDTTPPEITEVKLNSGSILDGTNYISKKNNLIVEGKVKDACGLDTDKAISIKTGEFRENVKLEDLEADGSWSVTIPKDDVTPNIAALVVITANDKAGRTTESNFYVYRDTDAPIMSITKPVAGDIINEKFKAILTAIDTGSSVEKVQYSTNYNEENPNDATWIEMENTSGTTWESNEVGLDSEGESKLYFRSTDSSENTSAVESREFYCDISAPVITETQLGIGVVSKKGNFTLGGEWKETNELKSIVIASSKDGEVSKTLQEINVNEKTTGSSQNPWVSQEITVGTSDTDDMGSGTYVITITATDVADRTANVVRNVRIDLTEPDKPIVSKLAGESTVNNSKTYYSGNITISGTAKDDDGTAASGIQSVQYSQNDLVWFPCNGTTNWTVTFPEENTTIADTEGEFTVYFRAFDNGGSVSDSITQTIYVDKSAPNATMEIDDAVQTGIYQTKGDVSGKIVFTGIADDAGTTPGRKAENATLRATKDGVTYSTTGFVWDKDAGTWSYSMDAGTDGSNDGIYIFTLEVTDIAGKKSTSTSTIQVDTGKPTLSITSPVDKQSFTTSNITIKGTAIDSGVGMAKNKFTYALSGDTESNGKCDSETGVNWEKEITLGGTEGTFSLTVTAEDTLGNKVTSTPITFYKDNANPIITETNIGSSGKTTNGNISLSGKWTETNELASIKVTGTKNDVEDSSLTKFVTLSNKNGTSVLWSIDYNDLPDGIYVFTITATDIAGKTNSTLQRTVIKDKTAPTITINTIPEYQKKEVAFNISGTATDNYLSGVLYKIVNSGEAPRTAYNTWTSASGLSTWSATMDMSVYPEGTYDIYFTATDNAGNYTTPEKKTIKLDGEAPVINITKKDDSEFKELEGSTYILKVKVVDTNSPSTIKWSRTGTSKQDTTEVSLSATKEVEIDETSLEDGDYKYTFTVTDLAGRTTEKKEIDTKIDTTKPTVTIDTPDNSATGDNSLTSKKYTFRGTATDPGDFSSGLASVKVAIVSRPGTPPDDSDDDSNKWETLNGTDSWNYTPEDELSEGMHTLFVKSIDKVGHESDIESRNFDIDVAAPSIKTKYSTTDGDVIELTVNEISSTKDYTLTGTITESNGVNTLTITRNGTEVFPTISADKRTFTLEESLLDGSYTYVVTVTDFIGKVTTETYKIRQDRTAPDVTISTPATDTEWQASSTVTVSGSASDLSGIASIWYTTDTIPNLSDINGTGGWTKASGTTNWFFTITGLLDGNSSKTVKVAAIDTVGNKSVTVIKRSINIDITKPTFSDVKVNGVLLNSTLSYSINSTTAEITGKISDSRSGIDTITSDVGTVTNTAGEWTLKLEGITSGSHTYTITAKDNVGNAEAKTITLDYDNKKPTVSITSPNGVSTGAQSLTNKKYVFAGKAADEVYSSGLASVKVAIITRGNILSDSDWKTAIGTNSWSYTPETDLSEGKYTLYVKSLDNAGNESDIESRDFDIDVAAPVIDVTSLVDGAIKTSSYTVEGTVTESNEVATFTITRNGVVVTGATIPSDKKSFSLNETPASDGIYTYVITATDTVGKETQKTVTVTYDKTAPTLSVTTPSADSSYSVSTSVMFKGTASDTASGVKTIKYSTNSTEYGTGTWTDVTGTTNWLVSCDLAEGTHKVAFVAIDEAGYASTVTTKEVKVDLTSPVLVVTNPTQTVKSVPITINGTIIETNLDTVKYKDTPEPSVPGLDVTFGESDAWSVEISSLTEGTYTYYITAKDKAGLTAQQTATVIYDKNAPTINTVTLTPSGTPTDSGWYKSSTVTVSVSVTDTVSGISAVYYAVYKGDTTLADADKDAQFATWETNGDWKVLSGTSGTYSKSVPLDDGAGYIYIKAVDEAGNISYSVSDKYKIDTANPTGSIAVTYKDSADPVTLTNCANDLVVSGTATDTGSGVGSVKIQINGADFTGNTATVTEGKYTCTIQPSVLAGFCADGEDGKSIKIKAIITDNANQGFTTSEQTVSLDRKKPVVVFTQPVKDIINGTVVVSGTSSDKNNVTSLVVQKSVADGTPVGITTTGSNYAWSFEYISTSDDKKVVKFTAVATDAAGNISEPVTKSVTADQDSDRPEITFTQIDLDGMTADNPAWTTSSTIYGTAEDDDGVLTSLTINASKYNGSGWNAFAAVTNNGTVSSWNVTLPEDGKYRLQFVAKDSTGKEFTASDTEAYSLVTPKLKGGSGTIGYSDSTIKATYAYVVVDTQAPRLTYDRYQLGVDGVTWDLSSTDSLVGKTFGGTRKYLRVRMIASDTNGMATTDAVKATLFKQGDSTTVSFNNTTGTFYESDAIDVSGKDGYYTLKVTATDKAGAKTEETYQFLLDNTAPSITLTSHTNNQQVGGHSSVVLRGITDDAKTINYDFVKNPDDPFNGTQLAGSPLSWKLAFDGDSVADETHAGLLNTYLYDKATATEKTDLWGAGGATGTTYSGEPIPVYVRLQVIDALGNSHLESYMLVVDPAGNRPSVTIEYPTDRATVSGTVRMYGSATDNSAINGVYVQYGTSATNWKTASGDIDGYVAIPGTSMYGFKASGNNSWGYAINTRNLTAEFGSSLWVRVYSVDDSSPSPAVSSPIVMSFTVDNAAPRIGDSKDLYLEQYAGDGTTVVASRKYEEGMWIQGEWYLSGSVEDENGIASVTRDGTPLVGGTSIITDYTSSLGGAAPVGATNYRLKVPVGALTGCGNTTFELEATDNDSSGGRTTSRTISINYDNTAPVLSQNATDGYTVKGEILNSNGFYQLGGVVNEDTVQDPSTGAYCSQSGFKYLAFYFLRRNSDKSGVVYDPMLLKSHDVNNVATGNLVYKNGLWWKEVSGVTATEGSSSITVTINSNMHRGGLVMIDGAMYKITEEPTATTVALDGQPAAGTGKTAYFAMALIADNLSAETATGTIGANGYYATANIRNDDGDGIVEYVERSGTKYSWFANVNSANIMDGDIEVHYVAFDAAGNYSIGVTGYEADRAAYIGTITATELTDCDTSGRLLAKDYHADNAFVSNNQPRLAGVRFGTDNDGNGDVDDNEYVSGWTALMPDYDYNVTGVAQGNSATETEATKISKVGYNASRAKVTEIVAGNATTPILTAKGVTKIIPTIIGGTKELSYTGIIPGYKLNGGEKTPSDTTLSATSLVTNLDSDGNDVTQTAIELMTELIDDYGDDDIVHTTDASGTAPSKFEFTIWTQTGGKTIGTNSQYAKITAYMNVMLGDSVAPVAKITPFYWKSATENSLYGNSRDNGHIELEADLPVAFNGTGLMDRDPKVSGKITYRGTVTDNTLIEKLCMRIATSDTEKFDFGTNKAKKATGEDNFTIATYNSSTKKWNDGAGNSAVFDESTGIYTIDDFNSQGWTLRFTSNISDSGHSITWELDLNTAEVTGTACLDAALKVIATDKGKIIDATKNSGKWTYTYGSANSSTQGTTQTTTDAETGYYKVDVVPYITKVTTGLSSVKAGYDATIYNRTARGHYPVNSETGADTISISGFNLNGDKTVDATTLSSGAYLLSVNGVNSINNMNENDAKGSYTGSDYDNYYNRYQNKANNNELTDDVVFDVWQFNNTAAKTQQGVGMLREPVMRINPNNGIVGIAFGDGPTQFSMPKKGTTNTYWQNNYATYINVSLAYDENGNSHGTATGLDTYADSNKGGRFSYFTSKWGISSLSDSGNFQGTNQSKMESIGLLQGTRVHGTDLKSLLLYEHRFYSPSIAVTKNGRTNPTVYLAYYDDVYNQIRFRVGNNTVNNGGTFGQIYDYREKQNDGDANYWVTVFVQNDCSLIAGQTGASTYIQSGGVNVYAGNYVSIAVIPGTSTASDIVVATWFDATNNQWMYSYNTTPFSEVNKTWTTATYTWSTPKVLATNAGEYCQIAVGSDKSVHIACKSQSNEILYTYIPTYAGTPQTVQIETYEAFVQEVGIDVRCVVEDKGTPDTKDDVTWSTPYVSYWANNRPKVAFPDTGFTTDSTVTAAVTGTSYNKTWEVSYVPTTSTLIQDHVNVQAIKSDTVKNAGTSDKFHTTGDKGAAIYTNGTYNPILGYGIRRGTSGFVEIAQIRDVYIPES